ncbi:MAG: isoprenylcysteine carboxylmethyltransferase family protein [Pseudomonadota bacterium]
MITQFQNLVQIIVIACLVVFGLGRILILKIQNVKVLVLDPQMTKTQMINVLVFVACFLMWIFESVTHGLSLNIHVPLALLHTTISNHIVIKIVGIIVLILGLLFYISAVLSIGKSWRIGIDRKKSGDLVTTGVFSWSRNPIYVALDLLASGTLLLQGELIFLILALCIVITLHVQILQEEKFLIQVHGDDYKQYCTKVGRYFKF